jgi:hypothetical protein
MDRKRKKKGSNKEWESATDPDARIAKMKDGSTHMAHKAEHAVDMESGAVIAVTLQAADQGDTTNASVVILPGAEIRGVAPRAAGTAFSPTADETPRLYNRVTRDGKLG